MNINNVKLGRWSALSLLSYSSGLMMGLYGRNRINFSSDFTYNKYHFGVFTNIASGAGLMMASKTQSPMLAGVCFLSAMINNSLPSFYEGLQDMKDEPFDSDTSLQRKIGTYSLILGYVILWKIY